MSFKIIVISSPEQAEEEIPVLLQLFEKGLKTFHLRKPNLPKAKWEAYLNRVPEMYHPNIVIHDYYPLASEYKLGGVHLTERSRKEDSTFTLLQQRQGSRISTSFHSLQAIADCGKDYDYVFLSPVFDSISKKEYKSSFSLEFIKQHFQRWEKQESYIPRVIALGGVQADNIAHLPATGFAGAALLGAIWQSPDPVASFLDIQASVS